MPPLFADEHESLVRRLYEDSQASRWTLAKELFSAALARSVQKRFSAAEPSAPQVAEYLQTLHADDLALACACAQGIESAWEHFIAHYRAYLRSAAAAILRCSASAPEASELADSIFAELYGLADGKRGECSLFRYFHGRSSLKTWLRAVLAQRHIDAIRAGKRLESLDEGEDGAPPNLPKAQTAEAVADPRRDHYLKLFARALQTCLDRLDAKDAERVRLYYAEEFTLAEIGRRLGEHESSVSRNLDRARKELRAGVVELLRRGQGPVNGSGATPGLSEAEIELAIEYASSGSQIDLDKMLTPPPQRPARKEES